MAAFHVDRIMEPDVSNFLILLYVLSYALVFYCVLQIDPFLDLCCDVFPPQRSFGPHVPNGVMCSLLLELAGTRAASAAAFPRILGIRVPYTHIGFISTSSKLMYPSKLYSKSVLRVRATKLASLNHSLTFK